jgi:hypothetical protein
MQETFPVIFDKSRLTGDEFKRYIYEIPFKMKGGGTRVAKGMTAAGHIRAIHPYLKSISTELLHYGTVGTRNILSCVVKVTVAISLSPGHADQIIVVDAIADGDVTGVPSADTLVRTVETRALNRALGRLLDLSNADLNNPNGEPNEEEAGTPVYRPPTLTEKMNARKEKEAEERARIAEEERDDEQPDAVPASGSDSSGDW